MRCCRQNQKTALAEALNAYKEKTVKHLKGEDKKAMTEAVDSYMADLNAAE